MVGGSYNGIILVSKTSDEGPTPSPPATKGGFVFGFLMVSGTFFVAKTIMEARLFFI